MHPVLAQKIFFPLQEFIKRKPTYVYLRALERSQWLSPEELRALQFHRLREQLGYAYREVPYYRELFDRIGLRPAQIHSLSDFAAVPHLDRDLIRVHAEDLQPRTQMPGTQKMSTGGSTGTPVAVYVDRERAAFTDAVRMRAHRWFGVDAGVREIALWGSPIELGRQGFIRDLRDRLINSRFLAAFNMGEAQMAAYAEFIQRYRPAKMYGYASAFYLLAEYLKNKNWRPPEELKVIFATAEPLYDFQRRLVEEVFDCAVAVEYGARDAGLLANECPKGGLHIPAEGIIIEIDHPDQTGLGEIVVTNLFSNAMPIIRYRTGDMGRLLDGTCACGRALPRLESVEGRRTDFLVTPSGRLLHALAIIYPLRENASIKQFQVIQEAIDRVVVRIVPEHPVSIDQRSELTQKLQAVLGIGVEITIDCVAEISSAASGKYRYVISKVAEEFIKDVAQPKEISAAV
jgi:phenylacetate-CoA ligase